MTLQAISLEGTMLSLTGAELATAQQGFASLFGNQVSLQDFVAAFEGGETNLALDSLSIATLDPNRFETRADFREISGTGRGTCSYIWRHNSDGTLTRTNDSSLRIDGTHQRLSLQIHGNLLSLSQRSGVVREFVIEARDVGRYAYRFMDGVTIEPEMLVALGGRLREYARHQGIFFDEEQFASLKSPREIADFLILSEIHDPWLTEVDEIIGRRGYQFTVDQVVDIARRPGLAALLDCESYIMRLDLLDDAAVTRFRDSVYAGRNQQALERIRGVIGTGYTLLPQDVRNALILFRPYIFPRPRKTPPLPDLTSVAQPQSPYNVIGFRSEDGRLLRSVPPDPQGTAMRDYRVPEIGRIVEAIESGVRIVTSTGLSGSGKTEVLIWNLEQALSRRGHRVVSLDALKLVGHPNKRAILSRIDQVLQPTVVIFDESVFISGTPKEAFVRFAHEFLRRPGQHLIFVGGGVISPQKQQRLIERELDQLFDEYEHSNVSLYPKPLNLAQSFRFLGLARLDWADEATGVGLLTYILERYPPYFIPFVPIRLHEHPEIRSVAAAHDLIDQEVDAPFWTSAAMMVIDGISPPLREGE